MRRVWKVDTSLNISYFVVDFPDFLFWIPHFRLPTNRFCLLDFHFLGVCLCQSSGTQDPSNFTFSDCLSMSAVNLGSCQRWNAGFIHFYVIPDSWALSVAKLGHVRFIIFISVPLAGHVSAKGLGTQDLSLFSYSRILVTSLPKLGNAEIVVCSRYPHLPRRSLTKLRHARSGHFAWQPIFYPHPGWARPWQIFACEIGHCSGKSCQCIIMHCYVISAFWFSLTKLANVCFKQVCAFLVYFKSMHVNAKARTRRIYCDRMRYYVISACWAWLWSARVARCW